MILVVARNREGSLIGALFLSSDDSFYISLRQVNTMSTVTFITNSSVPSVLMTLGLCESWEGWDYSAKGEFFLPVPNEELDSWLAQLRKVPITGLRVNGKKVK